MLALLGAIENFLSDKDVAGRALIKELDATSQKLAKDIELRSAMSFMNVDTPRT